MIILFIFENQQVIRCWVYGPGLSDLFAFTKMYCWSVDAWDTNYKTNIFFRSINVLLFALFFKIFVEAFHEIFSIVKSFIVDSRNKKSKWVAYSKYIYICLSRKSTKVYWKIVNEFWKNIWSNETNTTFWTKLFLNIPTPNNAGNIPA